MSQAVAGMLLVATPALVDPNFADSVVLLLDVDADGALGVVLNRPSGVPVGEVLDAWSGVVDEPDVLFQGGPVGADGALAVALLRDPEDVPVGFKPIDGLLGLVDLDAPVELLEGSLAALRIFAGYAGWGAEQVVGKSFVRRDLGAVQRDRLLADGEMLGGVDDDRDELVGGPEVGVGEVRH